MTAPTTADGGGVAVSVGKSALLLTEYAPITIINTSTTDRVWLASTSSVSPTTGVPLDPGTSYDWQTPGTLYGILDPAAADTAASLVLTGAGGDWTPSPVTIGVAVATQLAIQGVPSKLITTDLASYSVVASGAVVIPVDVSSFQSLFLFVTFAGSNVQPLTYQYQLLAANGTPYYVGEPDTLSVNDSNYVPGVVIPVEGSRLVITNPNAFAGTIKLFGLSRPGWRIPQGNGFQSSGFHTQKSIPASSSAGNYALTTNGVGSILGQLFQGPAYVVVQVSGGLPTDFAIALQVANVVTTFTYICDNTQFHAWPSVGGFKSFIGTVAFPASPIDIYAVMQEAVGSTPVLITVHAIPAYVL